MSSYSYLGSEKMLNPDIAYLLGMIVGKGQIVRSNRETEIVIDIPHKNLVIEGENTQQSVKSSLLDIVGRLKSLVGTDMEWDTSRQNIAHISFSKPNGDYLIRTINTYLKNNVSWRDFRIPVEIFSSTKDVKLEFLRGIADVTAHIRKSNVAWKDYENRVYVEIMVNCDLCIDIANLLKELDVPVQTIRFAHPNIVDPNLKKYNEGNKEFWNKEHQIKKCADLNRKNWKEHTKDSTKYKDKPISDAHHKFYWKTKEIDKEKQKHPEESSSKLPSKVRKHYDSWKNMAKELCYDE